MTPKFHTLTVSDICKETEDTVSVAFEVPESLKADYQYTSGQYLTLKAIIGGEDIRRSYSLCSAPYENEWRVAIKQVENGKFSSYANNQLNQIFKSLGLGVLTVLPFSPITIPFVIKKAQELGIDIIPNWYKKL